MRPYEIWSQLGTFGSHLKYLLTSSFVDFLEVGGSHLISAAERLVLFCRRPLLEVLPQKMPPLSSNWKITE